MACAFLNFLVLIPTKVSGLFFVEILDRYQVSRNLAGYPAFTITLVRCSGGPFAGYFAERFGINEVMLLGSLLAGVGISTCFFAEDIAAVTVFLGLIHGYFRGTLGSYAWLYHTIGLVSLACATLSALIPVLARMRDEKKSKRN
ncbi:hypothetical protein AVEN_39971-1 [Araneus ventricosus]|uniref:Major facilitator superfamily associated domain-containing protein n=1 Tax=Araneus ventricosus TaxID=182803 RepID=A0A4Y2TQC2_ARAVE|nr:hypothetical protein AVEN_39971-1 [Araneus ventricosus]